MSRFDVILSFDSGLRDLFGGGAFSTSSVTLLRLIDDDPLKLFLFVEEIRDIKEGVAFESDIDESRLHSRQHAHHAPFINVADDALIAFAALDVKLGNLLVFDDRDLFFASVEAYN